MILCAREKWSYGNLEIKLGSSYKYLGMNVITKHSGHLVLQYILLTELLLNFSENDRHVIRNLLHKLSLFVS